jgi:hypothetical protein
LHADINSSKGAVVSRMLQAVTTESLYLINQTLVRALRARAAMQLLINQLNLPEGLGACGPISSQTLEGEFVGYGAVCPPVRVEIRVTRLESRNIIPY